MYVQSINNSMKYLLSFCYFLYLIVGKAQESIDHYFDDGGISSSTHVIKFNCFSPVNGAYTLSLEKFVGQRLSLEGGVTYLANYYRPELSDLKTWSNPELYFKTNGGLGYLTQVKLHNAMPKHLTLSRSIGMLFRQRFYELPTLEQRTHTDIGLIFGLYQDFGRRISIDYETGFMYRSYTYTRVVDQNQINGNMIGLLTIRIGMKI